MKKNPDYIPVNFLDADMSVFFDNDTDDNDDTFKEIPHACGMDEIPINFVQYYDINSPCTSLKGE